MTHKITRREALVATAATAGAGLLGCVSAGTRAMSPPAEQYAPSLKHLKDTAAKLGVQIYS